MTTQSKIRDILIRICDCPYASKIECSHCEIVEGHLSAIIACVKEDVERLKQWDGHQGEWVVPLEDFKKSLEDK